MSEKPNPSENNKPVQGSKRIFEQLAGFRDTAEYNPHHFIPGLNEPIAPKFAERKSELDAERFHGAVADAVNEGTENFARAEVEASPSGRISRMFDELQARYRSEPWQEGGRFGYVDFPTDDAHTAARHREIEDGYDEKMNRALAEGVRRGLEESGVIFDNSDQEQTDIPPTV